MKITGIVLLVLGGLSLFGTLMRFTHNMNGSFLGPLVIIALGGFLVHKANKNKEKEMDKEKWNKE